MSGRTKKETIYQGVGQVKGNAADKDCRSIEVIALCKRYVFETAALDLLNHIIHCQKHVLV